MKRSLSLIQRREDQKDFDLGFKEPREISLQLGPDLRLYGLAKEAIFFIDPRNDQVSFVVKSTVPIHSGMAMLGRKIYFGSGANLWEFEIPLEPHSYNKLKIPPNPPLLKGGEGGIMKSSTVCDEILKIP